MQRSKLCNLYLEVRSDENRIRHKKQRNILSHYLEKLKGSTTKIIVKQMLLTTRRFGKE